MPKVSVYILEQNTKHLATLSTALLKLGCNVDAFPSFKMFWKVFKLSPPNLLIISYDVNYKWDIKKYLFEICDICNKRNISNPYIVTLDSYPNQRRLAISYEFGADIYLGKPITNNHLIEAIKNAATRFNINIGVN